MTRLKHTWLSKWTSYLISSRHSSKQQAEEVSMYKVIQEGNCGIGHVLVLSKASTSALQVVRLREALTEIGQALAHSERASSQEQQRLQGQRQQLQEQVHTLA